MILSDICVDPNSLILKNFSGITADVLNYYLFCNGTDPLKQPVDTANTLLQNYPTNVTTELNKLDAYRGAPNYETCKAHLNPLNATFAPVADADVQLNSLYQTLRCDEISKNYNLFVDTYLCRNDFDGLLIICIVLFITGGFLYASMCVSAVLYQYFGIFWRTGNADDDEEYVVSNGAAAPVGVEHPHYGHAAQVVDA